MILLLAAPIGLGGCTGSPPDTAAAGPDVAPLPSPELLRRMSLDLRGVLPSADDLDTVEDDPDAIDALRDQYLSDARFGDRIVSMYAETWHTRIDMFGIAPDNYGLPEERYFEFIQSVGEEPLRLLAHVAETDRPWTDIVTVDYTMADEVLGEIWDLDYPDDSSGWQVSHYLDGRPAGGVLATNGLWWRYVTNTSNLNRSRAAAISKLLLCEDYLQRPVSFSATTTSLSDTDGTAQAVKTEPACVGCHSSIDPVASAMFGFYNVAEYNRDDFERYHPEREVLGEDLLGTAPGYFGKPVGGLADLGAAIAEDPRFVRCAAQTMAQTLWRRPVRDSEFDTVSALRDTFVQSGLTMRSLITAVMDTDAYRAGSLTDSATDDDASTEMTVRMMSPDQLETAIADLTGFRWIYETYPALEEDRTGYRVLAGGVDGDTVGSPQRDPGLTSVLVDKRLAEAAASYAVDRELVDGAEDRRLFLHVTLESAPGDDDFTEELEDLHWRLYGTHPDDDRIAACEALWSSIAENAGPAEAWKGLASALLRDPAFVGY